MPASYRPHTRGDDANTATQSQTIDSNISVTDATVADVLKTKHNDVISITPDQTIAQAVAVLRDNRIGALVVTDHSGDLVGILSERDIVRRMADTPGETLSQTVQDLMTHSPKTCTTEESLVQILRLMTDGRFRHMPVIAQGKLTAIITIGDVVNYRLNQLEYEALKLKQLVVG